MRYAILSILLFSLLLGCNRDATSAEGSFLAPANQPDNNTMPSKDMDERSMGMTKQTEDALIDEGKTKVEPLSAEDLAAARRPGSRADKVAVSGEADPQKTKNVQAMPTPTTAGKPVLDYDRPIFAISKTPCYGECEQYSLTLTNDRQLILNAKKHMDKKGEYRIRLNAREYNSLISGLDSLNLQQLPAVFPNNIKTIPSDIQATVLRFPDNVGGEEMKKVEVYFDAPDQLTSFLQRFEAMVARKDWVAVKP
ncbi:MAG: DUF6438 domain-containing protein [Lewinella sp.]